jgi:hypothetical protein
VLDGSERITSPLRDMVTTFDPTKPFSFEIAFESKPAIKWVKSYRGVEVTVTETGNLDTDTKVGRSRGLWWWW